MCKAYEQASLRAINGDGIDVRAICYVYASHLLFFLRAGPVEASGLGAHIRLRKLSEAEAEAGARASAMLVVVTRQAKPSEHPLLAIRLSS